MWGLDQPCKCAWLRLGEAAFAAGGIPLDWGRGELHCRWVMKRRFGLNSSQEDIFEIRFQMFRASRSSRGAASLSSCISALVKCAFNAFAM